MDFDSLHGIFHPDDERLIPLFHPTAQNNSVLLHHLHIKMQVPWCITQNNSQSQPIFEISSAASLPASLL